MIDCHTHLLPGLDDGVSSWEEAITLARAAALSGTTAIILTPHYMPEAYTPSADLIRERTAEFQARLAAAGLSLRVYPGSEVYLFPQLPEVAKAGVVLPMAGSRHLLVELPLLEIPRWADEVLFELQLAGFIPILAHPERCAGVCRRPEWVKEVVARGVRVQVNGPSLGGAYGREARNTAVRLLKAGLVHYLGSDAHSARRPASIAPAAAQIRRLLGSEAAQEILETNPTLLTA